MRKNKSSSEKLNEEAAKSKENLTSENKNEKNVQSDDSIRYQYDGLRDVSRELHKDFEATEKIRKLYKRSQKKKEYAIKRLKIIDLYAENFLEKAAMCIQVIAIACLFFYLFAFIENLWIIAGIIVAIHFGIFGLRMYIVKRMVDKAKKMSEPYEKKYRTIFERGFLPSLYFKDIENIGVCKFDSNSIIFKNYRREGAYAVKKYDDIFEEEYGHIKIMLPRNPKISHNVQKFYDGERKQIFEKMPYSTSTPFNSEYLDFKNLNMSIYSDNQVLCQKYFSPQQQVKLAKEIPLETGFQKSPLLYLALLIEESSLGVYIPLFRDEETKNDQEGITSSLHNNDLEISTITGYKNIFEFIAFEGVMESVIYKIEKVITDLLILQDKISEEKEYFNLPIIEIFNRTI